MFDDFFAQAHALLQQGEPFATAVVVRADRPTSGKPGDKAIVTRDGVMVGWIGGSCAQPTVIAQALEALAEDRARLVRITPEPGAEPPRDGVMEVPMTCFSGGTLEVYIEPQHPRPRLVVVGHLPVAKALVHLGSAMSYHTVAVDPETGGAGLDEADQVVTDLDEIPKLIHPSTFVVVATHGHYDEPALEKALSAGARYVGLVASPKRTESVVDHLRRQGVPEEALAALHAPAGLDLGCRRGDEIALSILAEIVQLRRRGEVERVDGVDGVDAVDLEKTAAAPGCCSRAEPDTAVDPICGMSVKVEGALHTHEHEGTVYYFCCGGCRSRFAEEPARYLAG